jgi:hypothetical protein
MIEDNSTLGKAMAITKKSGVDAPHVWENLSRHENLIQDKCSDETFLAQMLALAFLEGCRYGVQMVGGEDV